MPPPMTTTRRPTGRRRVVRRLAQPRDEVDRVDDAVERVLAGEAERVDAGEADAEEHRVEVLPQVGEVEVAPERPAGLDLDAADRRG